MIAMLQTNNHTPNYELVDIQTLRAEVEQKITYIMRYLHVNICAEEDKGMERNQTKVNQLKKHYNEYKILLQDTIFRTDREKMIRFLSTVK